MYTAIVDSLDSAIKECKWGYIYGASRDALSDFHKDAQEGKFELALKGALDVALELHLWLHLLMQSWIHKYLPDGSSNGEPNTTLEGALHGRRNVELEWVP